MRAILVALAVSCVLVIPLVAAGGEPTSLADAQAAIEANLRTPEGKAYDETVGNELLQKHSDELRKCKQSAAGDLESFWMLLKMDKAGAVDELLLQPATSMGTCARKAVLGSRFTAPPHPAYWVGVYLKLRR
jgi:hypothetical protein